MLYEFTTKDGFLQDRTVSALQGPFDTKPYEQRIQEENSEGGIIVYIPPSDREPDMTREIEKNLINPYIHDYLDHAAMDREDDDLWTDEYIAKCFDSRPFNPLYTKLDRVALQYLIKLDSYGWPGNPFTDIMFTKQFSHIDVNHKHWIPELIKLVENGLTLEESRKLLPFKFDTEIIKEVFSEFGFPHVIDQAPPKIIGDQPMDKTPYMDGNIAVERPHHKDIFSNTPFKILDIGVLNWVEREFWLEPLPEPQMEHVRNLDILVYRRPFHHSLNLGVEFDQKFYATEEWVKNDLIWFGEQVLGEKLPAKYFESGLKDMTQLPDNQLYDAAISIIRVEINIETESV